MEILFIHGAGGWEDDQPLVDELRTLLGAEVAAPRFPDDDMSAAAWRRVLDRHLISLGPEPVIVGHSFGASMALLHLADHSLGSPTSGLALLAMPFWGSEGWEAEYSLPADAELPADLPVWLHHCRDDDVVPIAHLEHHAARLPQALVRRYETGGHQFHRRMGAVAADLAGIGG